MVEISVVYQGALRCLSTHQPSGTQLLTDAPVDNHGKGESFSPTDLMATALGTCILTTMGIVADMIGVDLGESRVTIRKEMTASPHRRIAALPVTITVPAVLDEAQKQKLIRAAEGCPVKHSLHPDIQIPMEFIWG